jgi:hypothetical protein
MIDDENGDDRFCGFIRVEKNLGGVLTIDENWKTGSEGKEAS